MLTDDSQERKLSDVLSEFARTMATDFPIQAILDHLIRRIVEMLPITAAGVTLITPGEHPRYIGASDASALLYEKLQTELGEGPCLLAYTTGAAVEVPELRDEQRFPNFTPRALAEGMRAVFTFPLRNGDHQLGALDLYRDTPGVLSSRALATSQTLADVATAYLVNARAREELKDLLRTIPRAGPARCAHRTAQPDIDVGTPRPCPATQPSDREIDGGAVPGPGRLQDHQRHLRTRRRRPTAGGGAPAGSATCSAPRTPWPGCTATSSSSCAKTWTRPTRPVTSSPGLITAMAAPFALAAVRVEMTVSMGIAFADHHHRDAKQVLRDADTAMYEAKRRGGAGQQVFDPRVPLSEGREGLQRDLHHAVSGGELHTVYQPIVTTHDGADHRHSRPSCAGTTRPGDRCRR